MSWYSSCFLEWGCRILIVGVICFWNIFFIVSADCMYLWCSISVVSNALVSCEDLFSSKLKSFTLMNYLMLSCTVLVENLTNFTCESVNYKNKIKIFKFTAKHIHAAIENYLSMMRWVHYLQYLQIYATNIELSLYVIFRQHMFVPIVPPHLLDYCW